MFLGVAYGAWDTDFSVFAALDTFSFDMAVNASGVDEDQSQTSVFKVSDDIVLDIENKGTVGVYLERVEVTYNRSNGYKIGKKIDYEAVVKYDDQVRQAGMDISGRTLRKKRPIDFAFNADQHLIEPQPYAVENYKIEFVKSKSLDDILEPYREEQRSYEASLDSAISHRDALASEISYLRSSLDSLRSRLAQLESDLYTAIEQSRVIHESSQDEDDDDNDEDDDDDDDQTYSCGPSPEVEHLRTEYDKVCREIRQVACRLYQAECEKGWLQGEICYYKNQIACLDQVMKKIAYAYHNDEIVIKTSFELFNR